MSIKYAYNIADNSTAGINIGNVEGSNGKSVISRDEFACLLMLFHENDVLEFSRFGSTVYLRADINAIPYPSNLPKFERLVNCAAVDIRWVEIVDSMLGRSTSANKTTNSIRINAYKDEKCTDYNSSFTFYINSKTGKEKGKNINQYFVNANCSPTQLLIGNNALPFNRITSPSKKAEFLIDMFTLPFYILGNLIDTYVLKKGVAPCNLSLSAASYDNSILKLQIADYCKQFSSNHERNFYHSILDKVYTTSKIRSSDGVSIPHSLRIAVDDKESEEVHDKLGRPIARTGFMLKFTSSDKPTFSLGFYNKDLVTKSQQNKKDKDKVVKDDNNSIEEFTRLSIRLDLSIHTQGLIKLSREFSKAWPDCFQPLPKSFKASDVKDFLTDVLKFDPTMGVIYKFVLEEEMLLEQMLRVTTKQWDKAWELLKNKGFYDLIPRLKRRRNLVGNDESYSSLVKKYCGENVDPTRLREEIQKATVIYLKDAEGNYVYAKDDRGLPTKERIVICNGVDLRFPYFVKLQVDDILRDSFKDLEMNRVLHETGRIPNNYDLVKLHNKAIRAGRKLVRVLSYGDNLEPIPVFMKSKAA